MRRSKQIPIVFTIMIVGFIFFLSSKTWINVTGDLVEPTEIGTEIVKDNTTVSLQRWDYDAKKRMMEIELGITTTDIGEKNYTFSGTTRRYGKIDMKCIANDEEMVILQATKIPEQWREIAITIEDQDKKIGKIFTIAKTVNRKTIEKKTKSDYLVAYYQNKITTNEEQMEELDEKIEKNKVVIDDTMVKIEDVTKQKEYMTDEQITQADNEIEELKNQIRTLQSDNKRLTEEKAEIKKRNSMIRVKISDTLNGERQ